MRREELEGLGWTDEELTKSYRSLFDDEIDTVASTDEDTKGTQRRRRVRFNRVTARLMGGDPPERTGGPMLGAYSENDPDGHFRS